MKALTRQVLTTYAYGVLAICGAGAGYTLTAWLNTYVNLAEILMAVAGVLGVGFVGVCIRGSLGHFQQDDKAGEP